MLEQAGNNGNSDCETERQLLRVPSIFNYLLKKETKSSKADPIGALFLQR